MYTSSYQKRMEMKHRPHKYHLRLTRWIENKKKKASGKKYCNLVLTHDFEVAMKSFNGGRVSFMIRNSPVLKGIWLLCDW